MSKKKTVRQKPQQGKLLKVMSSYAEHVAEHAPELVPIYMTLAPFEDVIVGVQAGPQKQAKGYDPRVKPHFHLDIDDPRYPGNYREGTTVSATINADRVVMTWVCIHKDGESYMDELEMTLPGLWNYLRQITRPYQSFRGDV